MSWVDLAALTMMFWSAAKGYLSGVVNTLAQFVITVIALPVAFYFHQPLVVFLNRQWHVEAVFVGWYTSHTELVLTTVQGRGANVSLPSVAVGLAQLFVPELQVLPVMTRESTLQLLGTLLIRLITFLAFVFFFSVLIRYFLRMRQLELNINVTTEWRRLLGLVLGAGHGLVLAMIVSITLDALSLLLYSGLWAADFQSSYLAKLASLCMQIIF